MQIKVKLANENEGASTCKPVGAGGFKENEMNDNVNNPSHYNQGGIEVIDIMKAYLSSFNFWGYCQGNVIKYVLRSNHKGNCLEDLKKAQWYLNRLIADMESEI